MVASVVLFIIHRLVGGCGWAVACILVATGWLAYAGTSLPYYGQILFFPAFLLGALINAVPRRLWQYPTLLIGVVVVCTASLIFGRAPTGRAVEMIGATAIVGCISALQPPVLLRPLSLFVGRISYPLYLSHWAGVVMVGTWVRQFAGPHVFLGIALLACGSLMVTVPLAMAICIFFERPLMRTLPRVPPVSAATRAVPSCLILLHRLAAVWPFTNDHVAPPGR